MNSAEIATYFRTLSSEGDLSFLDNTKLALLLSNAHREFRRLVTKIDPSNYETTLNITPNGTTYSLVGTLFGSAATNRATRISRLTWTTGNATKPLIACSSYETLQFQYPETAWWLQGGVLTFNTTVTSPVTVTYVPATTFNWLANIAAATYVEDLCEEFGDLIALLAYNAYKIQDYQDNPWQSALLGKRQQELLDHLSATRNGNAQQYVSETWGY